MKGDEERKQRVDSYLLILEINAKGVEHLELSKGLSLILAAISEIPIISVDVN